MNYCRLLYKVSRMIASRQVRFALVFWKSKSATAHRSTIVLVSNLFVTRTMAAEVSLYWGVRLIAHVSSHERSLICHCINKAVISDERRNDHYSRVLYGCCDYDRVGDSLGFLIKPRDVPFLDGVHSSDINCIWTI